MSGADSDLPVVVSGTTSCVAVESGKWDASTLLARAVRPTTGLLRASTMTLHVGLGSACCRNLIRIWSRHLSDGNSLWTASTTWCGSFNFSPSSYDLFCVGSSSSNTSAASSGVSVSLTAGPARATILSLFLIHPPKIPTFRHLWREKLIGSCSLFTLRATPPWSPSPCEHRVRMRISLNTTSLYTTT